MMQLPRGSEATLKPLISALEAAAQTRVSAIDSAARTTAKQSRDAAARDRDEVIAAATAAGERDAEAAAALASAHIRRTASELVLAKQEEIRTDLRQHIRAEARALKDDPAYPSMLKHLTTRATQLLGARATVTESSDGGLTAVAGSRRVDLTLPTLAIAKFDELSVELSPLWQK